MTEPGDRGPTQSPRRRIAYVNRRAPHGTIYALEALEVVLIGAAFDQDVVVIFLDDGVFQLKSGQDTAGIGTKDFSPTYRALPDFDVERIVVERESLAARGLAPADLLVPVEVRDAAEVGALLESADVVLSF